ncbi:uncharacterized protein BYT42DRAFT_393385 [Radiomyces spectabilis]|uniref:uncharacterized protein n=1 Tax=Radiomyces spectabilis TaxID=64574 RepID=UPI00221FD67C|nr:uncharacterized protein BYT42DRAFT_393385 [Radiomyces spectabilis]KAI8374175.1 hypothetical protein BYT42DRAFT_393385 [Radiomyces spectabilis]
MAPSETSVLDFTLWSPPQFDALDSFGDDLIQQFDSKRSLIRGELDLTLEGPESAPLSSSNVSVGEKDVGEDHASPLDINKDNIYISCFSTEVAAPAVVEQKQEPVPSPQIDEDDQSSINEEVHSCYEEQESVDEREENQAPVDESIVNESAVKANQGEYHEEPTPSSTNASTLLHHGANSVEENQAMQADHDYDEPTEEDTAPPYPTAVGGNAEPTTAITTITAIVDETPTTPTLTDSTPVTAQASPTKSKKNLLRKSSAFLRQKMMAKFTVKDQDATTLPPLSVSPLPVDLSGNGIRQYPPKPLQYSPVDPPSEVLEPSNPDLDVSSSHNRQSMPAPSKQTGNDSPALRRSSEPLLQQKKRRSFFRFFTSTNK